MTTARTPAPGPRSYYRERSRRFLPLADEMLGRNEPEVACEMVWGAAAHAIKASASARGWPHGEHRLLRITINRLVQEENAPSYLIGQYDVASAFHSGFYGDFQFTEGNIRAGQELIAQFIQTLEGLG